MVEPVLAPTAAVWLAVLLALVTALVVLISALLERSGPIRLRHWAEKSGGRLLELYDTEHRFDALRLIFSLAARLLPVGLAWAIWEALIGYSRKLDLAAGVALAAVTLLVVLLEWGSRWLVADHSEEALARLTGPLRGFAAFCTPVIWLLAMALPADDADEEDEDEASDDEIDAYIDVGVREGILEPEEEELVRSIVDFGDTQVRSVMTPRVEVVSAPVASSPEDLCQRFFESKHARLPLFRDSVDEIVGILHIRDLFEAMQAAASPAQAGLGEDGAEDGAATTDNPVVDVAAIANAPYYVPESKPLRQLLQEMQALHQQMAIVVDEYGGVAGLVTVEDLIEEIVGEISDEHEQTHVEDRVSLGTDHWRVPGRTDLEELELLFGIDPDELPYETVSGLICGELGYVPKPGEIFVWGGLRFLVEDADERRVTSVAVQRDEPALVEER